jgi:hypothetical protein
MVTQTFKQNLQAYSQWKMQLGHAVREYQRWLTQQDQQTPEASQRIQQALEALRGDNLTIAFVAEFSRGKTELINAIFFADYGRRLLPSAAGRTTMCPTELLWDNTRSEAYLRLLPIETRNQDSSVAELRQDGKNWVYYPLNTDSAEQMETALRQLAQTKRVSPAEAQRLGLHHDAPPLAANATESDLIEIPRWRHAIVSFPHPLLKQGLVILDTPGLNALGSEPELTLSTLPGAQAVLFVLAADTGVTRSDLEMWQHHIQSVQSNRQQGFVVVLNKIDTLWDGLKDDSAIQNAIDQQKQATAHTLGIHQQAIFAVSAQKGLVGKIKQDADLLHKSAIDTLESHLASDMLSARRQIVLDAIEENVGQLIDNDRGLVAQKLANIKRQLNELEELRDKSSDVIKHLLEKTRNEQAQYLDSVAHFQSSRRELQQEAKALRQMLDLEKIEALMDSSHHDMLHSWTTRGMKKTMKFLFDELRRSMQAISGNAEHTRKTVRSAYQRFQNEFGFSTVQPQKFSVMKYRVELEALYKEADAFRRSPTLALSEQSFVVKRFYHILVARARGIFNQLNQQLDFWLSHALDPLVAQIQEHKDMMEKRLVNLQKIGRSKHTLQMRIEDLEGQYAALARQLTALRNMYNNIHLSRPTDIKKSPKLQPAQPPTRLTVVKAPSDH